MKGAAVLAISLLWNAGSTAGEVSFVTACEGAVKQRLLAPSTYHFVKASEDKEAVSFDAYFAKSGYPESVQKLMRLTAKDTPVRLVASIEYVSSSAAGVPVRSRSRCTYESLGQPSLSDETGKLMVEIDGKSNTQWLAERSAARR
ncbi:hypothetical protein ABIA95_003084 [Bradyrhizobium sp. LA8.1]|uniref:hypothetical protein n=1 Tax=unclassified Bradyrhizobium TaxID=2631580 RepID=UPI003392BB3A